MSGKLAGRRAVITGGSQGLGFVMARNFLQQGASVTICSRTAADIRKALALLSLEVKPEAVLRGMVANVAEPGPVQRLACYAATMMGGVDLLVCNAAIQGPIGAFETTNWRAWVQTLQVDLFGTALCCKVFLPFLRQSSRGKIILMSGGGATRPRPNVSAYATAKTGVVRFGETLAEELRERGARIDVNAVAPGPMNTRLLEELLKAGQSVIGATEYTKLLAQKRNGGASLDKAAELCVFLASRASDGISGRLISAVWDTWNDLPVRASQLASTDVYTLRRIVPSDRGLAWR